MDINTERDRILALANQSNDNIKQLVMHAFLKMEENGSERIVNSDIGKIEKSGEIAIAREIARIAYQRNPSNVYFVVKYGTLLLKQNYTDPAYRLVNTYEEMCGDPQNEWFSSLKASILKSKKEYDLAIKILEKLPRKQLVTEELADCYYLAGKRDIAKSLLESVQLSQKGALILAKIYKHDHLPDKALAVLKPFGNTNKNIDIMIKDLNRITGPTSQNAVLEPLSNKNDNIDISTKIGSSISESIEEFPIAIERRVSKFWNDHNRDNSVIVMMKFAGDNNIKNEKLKMLFNTIKKQLDIYGLEAVRADEKTYCETGYIFENVEIYLCGCKYGIAVLENIYSSEINPNVALEYGYMLARGKKVLLLKEKEFTNLRADLLGKIWKEFEIDNPDTVIAAITKWMVDLEIGQK